MVLRHELHCSLPATPDEAKQAPGGSSALLYDDFIKHAEGLESGPKIIRRCRRRELSHEKLGQGLFQPVRHGS